MPLKTKQIGKYTASQIGALQGANLRIHQRKISEMGAADGMLEALQEWALVSACVTPFISLEEWLDTPLIELRPLVEAVEELNSEMVQPAETTPKKKPPKAQKSNSA